MAATRADRSEEATFDPTAYRRWFETPLGSRVDSDEKQVVFAGAARPGGRLVLGEHGRYSIWALLRRVKGLRKTTYRNARFFGPHELVGLLRRAGFGRVTWCGAVMYPPIAAPIFLALLVRGESTARRWIPWAAAFFAVRGESPAAEPACCTA